MRAKLNAGEQVAACSTLLVIKFHMKGEILVLRLITLRSNSEPNQRRSRFWQSIENRSNAKGKIIGVGGAIVVLLFEVRFVVLPWKSPYCITSSQVKVLSLAQPGVQFYFVLWNILCFTTSRIKLRWHFFSSLFVDTEFQGNFAK